uniref:Rieske domain-containing protein n=1 Tax=Vitis vinifera TaxID=29760 RepID=F6GUK6_VITVI
MDLPRPSHHGEEKFDWLSQWYPVAPVCDLDKRKPHSKRVIGLDVVVWWDRNESEWKVFDDACAHRLAPLSEGRIDQWGRLQCVYHGWCFNGSGDCKFIPQAPPDGPPVHTFKKARAAVYPSAVQHGIVWFWPNTDPQFKDIFTKKRPPYIPELDDLSYTKSMGARDFPFGYEILMENVMDPAHVAYAHYGIADREGGTPIEISVKRSAIDGFDAERELARSKFIPPCLYYTCLDFPAYQSNESVSSGLTKEEPSSHMSPKRALLILICVPVSPGNSRLIWTFPRNFGLWTDHIIPRWMLHMSQNLILDSDLYLLHLEERKIMKAGPSNWHKACFVPTKSDAHIVAFRAWLRKYSGGQLDWGTNFSSALPPTPPKEQLMDRYWSHVVNCSSCSVAYKGLQVLEVVLQIFSIALIGIPVINHGVMSVAARITAVSMAILCFAASRWLSYFIYKTFHFHDYTHAFC